MSPDTAILTGYFQGGKMFRALLPFVAMSALGIELGVMVPMVSALELMRGIWSWSSLIDAKA